MESYTRVEDNSLADEEAYQPEGDDDKSALSLSSDETQAPTNSSDGKLILAEEVIQGGGMRAASEFRAFHGYRCT